MGILREDLCPFMLITRWIIFGMGYISGRSRRENQNTHFMLNNVFSENRLLWDNVEEYDRAGQATDDNILRPMLFACWIPKAHNM
jgi:hypothetical protein